MRVILSFFGLDYMKVAHILSGSAFLVFQKFLERFKFAGVLNFKSKIVVPKNGVNELVRGATDNKGKPKFQISTIYLFFARGESFKTCLSQ